VDRKVDRKIIKLPQKPIYEISTKITSPYDIDDPERPVLDIIINSNGGDAEILKSMYTILDIAKARGAIVRTTKDLEIVCKPCNLDFELEG